MVFKYQGQDLLLGSVGLWLYVGPFDQVYSSLCLARTTHLLPPLAVYIIAGVLFVIFVTDFVLTNVHIAQFNDKLKDFQQRISGRVTGEKGQNEVYAKAGIEPENNKKLQEITEKLSLRERVMLKNTFSFQATKYTDLVDRLKDNLGYKQ